MSIMCVAFGFELPPTKKKHTEEMVPPHPHVLVIARKDETLDWLESLPAEVSEVFVYNDGAPVTGHGRRPILRDLRGDSHPTEATKYVSFILSHWDDPGLTSDTRVTFLQADPFHHSPSILDVFQHTCDWSSEYQNLCLYAHPPPWPLALDIVRGRVGSTQVFGTGRVWHDELRDNFQGRAWNDPWVESELMRGVDNAIVTVPYLCRQFGVDPPPRMKKAFAALFSTTWGHIRSFPKSVWEAVHRFLVFGDDETSHLSVRMRGGFMEYMWAVILESPTAGTRQQS